MEKKFKGNHKACTVPGCDKQQWKGGMCYKHFHQQAESNQIEPKANQRDTGTQNQEAPGEFADELETLTLPPAEPSTTGLSTLLPIVEEQKPGYFLDFSERLTEFRILEKNGVTPGQIVDMLCMVAGGGYELRKVGQ